MKMFMRVNSVMDYEFLQADLNRLISWGETLNLKLNLAKCQVMTSTRSSKLPDYNYKIHWLSTVHAGASIRYLG